MRFEDKFEGGQRIPRKVLRRRARKAKAAERRALMRGRRAALSSVPFWARGVARANPREIVRSVVVEPRDAGWELTARMSGKLKCFGMVRGFLRSPEYELRSQR